MGIGEKIDDIWLRDLTQFFRHPLSVKFIGEIKALRDTFLLVHPPIPSRGKRALRSLRVAALRIDDGQNSTDLMRENLVWLTFECLWPRSLDVLLCDTLTASFTLVGQLHL